MDLLKTKSAKLATMAAAVAVLAYGATSAEADGLNGGGANGTANASFDSTVTVAQTQAMDFGSMVAITDGTGGTLNVVLTKAGLITYPGVAAQAAPWNPTGGPAAIGTGPKARAFPTGLGTVQAAVFTITGVAFGANMGIIYNGAGGGTVGTPGPSPAMTCGACATAPAVAPIIDTFTDNTTSGVIAADGTGTITLNVGATLRIDNSIDNMNLAGSQTAVVGALEDGTYSTTYTVAAIY